MSHVKSRLDQLPSSSPLLTLHHGDSIAPEILDARADLLHTKVVEIGGVDVLGDVWIHGLDDAHAELVGLERLAMFGEETPVEVEEGAFFEGLFVEEEEIEAEDGVFVRVFWGLLAACFAGDGVVV